MTKLLFVGMNAREEAIKRQSVYTERDTEIRRQELLTERETET